MSGTASLEWYIVAREVRKKLDELTEKLEAITVDQLPRIQGEIRSLRWVLSLPDMLITTATIAESEAAQIAASKHNLSGYT